MSCPRTTTQFFCLRFIKAVTCDFQQSGMCDQLTRSLIRASACRLHILLVLSHLEFLSLKEAVHACLSLHLSKCHIVGNQMLWLIYDYDIIKYYNVWFELLNMSLINLRGSCYAKAYQILIQASACPKSHFMRFPTMWYVRPAKAQTSLRIRAV